MKKITSFISILLLQFTISTSAFGDLVGLWMFEGDGAQFTDGSGYDNHASPAHDPNDPVRVPGDELFGYALEFGGDGSVDDYATAPDSTSLSVPGDFTLSARIYVEDYSQDINTIVYKGNGGSDMSYRFSVKQGGYLNLSIRDSNGSKNFSGYYVDSKAWVHVAVVRHMDTGDIEWYKNGIRAKTESSIHTGIMHDSTGDLVMGAEKQSASEGGDYKRYFGGKIDDIKIYDHALTAAEMLNAAQPSTEVLSLPMDEGIGATVNDDSAFNNDGTFGAGGFSPAWTDVGGDAALSMDGGDYVSVESDLSIASVPNGLTLSAEVLTSVDGIHSIIYKNDTSGPFAYRFNVKADGYLNLSVNDGTQLKNFSGFYVAPGEWTKCTVSIDMKSQKVVWYKNDVFNKAAFFTELYSIKNSEGPLLIGARDTSGSEGLNGSIDDVQIHNIPTLENPEALPTETDPGEFELTMSDTGHSSPVTVGSVSDYTFTIKNTSGMTKAYSILAIDDHLLVGKTSTLFTETLDNDESRQISLPVDASQPGSHRIYVEVMTTASPQTTVGKASTTVNIWNPIGNAYEDNVPNFFGIMSVFDKHLDKIDADTAIMKAMGAKISRVIVRWNKLQENEGGDIYDWSHTDAMFGALDANDITISAFLWSTPKNWAIDTNAWNVANAIYGGNRPNTFPPQYYSDYYNAMADLADRYNNTQTLRPQVPYWEIWNEPYITEYWWYPDDPNDPDFAAKQYLELLENTYATVKNIDPGATVVLAGQAPTGRDFSDYVVKNGSNFYDIYAYHSHGYVNQHITALETSIARLDDFDPTNKMDGWWCNETGFAFDVTNDTAQSIALIKKGTISRYANLKNFMWFIFRNKEETTGTVMEMVDGVGGMRPSVVAYNALATLLHGTSPDVELFANDPADPSGNFGYSFTRDNEKVLVLWNENKLNNVVDIPVEAGITTAKQYNVFGAETDVVVSGGNLTVTLDYAPVIFVLPEKDTDQDGVVDSDDNCPAVYNPDQLDLDNDAMGDVCDPDADGDNYLAGPAPGGDCNDLDENINPGIIETSPANDGIDQNCDGYDLSIIVIQAEVKGHNLYVTASSDLGAAANLSVRDYGDMQWGGTFWTTRIRFNGNDIIPTSIFVEGIEGYVEAVVE